MTSDIPVPSEKDRVEVCDCWNGWSENHDHPTLGCRHAPVMTVVGGSTLTGFIDVPVCRECGRLIESGP